MAYLLCGRLAPSLWAPVRRASTHKDSYAILGVSSSSTAEEIKSAYYAKSKLHHPDVNPMDTQAHSQFALIAEAYSVLGNTAARALYDQGATGTLIA